MRRAWVQALAASDAGEAAVDRELNPFADELAQVRGELRCRGFDVRPVRPGAAWPGPAELAEAFVFGDRHFMARAVDILGLAHRVACSYPAALAGRLGRRHWIGTPDERLQHPAWAPPAQFVKPCCPTFHEGRKVLAEVFDGPVTASALPPGLRGGPVFCSEVVEWMSEYRCYVTDSRIVGVHGYAMRLPGEGWTPQALEQALPAVRPSDDWLATLVRDLDTAGASVAGYCLDVGLIAFGDMALVEMNDGLALTNYGLAPADYVDLHLARWRSLVQA